MHASRSDRFRVNRFASPPPTSFLKLPTNRRHSSSALICASGDFFYYDRSNVRKYEEDKSSSQTVVTPKKGKISQLFGKLVDKNSPNKSVDRHQQLQSWTSAIFRVRRKENKLSTSKTSFSKIEEETTTNDTGQQTSSTYSQSIASNYRRRFKSKSERDLDGITHLCPNLGIRSIERGSQTESENASFGVASIWYEQLFLSKVKHFPPF